MAVDLPISMIAATVELEQPQPGGSVRIVGTGFLVNAPRPDGTARTVLVTAGHVFDDMPGATAYVDYRLQTPDGGWRYSPQPLAIRSGASLLWTRNPDQDVAVMEVKAPPEFARAAIPLNWLAGDDSFAAGGIEPGDQMFALGFPKGYAANPNGFPILRSANVASYPLVPSPAYPSFMLDMRVFEGASGGPVFLASALERRPGTPMSGDGYLTGLVVKAAEKYEWAFVIEAPVIRRTIGLLDSPSAPVASAASGGFAMLPARPPAASAAASTAP